MRPSFTRYIQIWVGLLLGLLAVASPALAAPKVYVIDIHGAVWPGVAKFVTTQINDAWKAGASGIILDLDTTSGTNDAAVQIKAAILARAGDLPIVAYVHDHGTGPGSLIAVSCKTLAMSPGASLGAAPDGLKSDLRAAAEATGRNSEIAAAFVSADAPLPSLGVPLNGTLTLTASQAQHNGYADVLASDYPDVLAKMGFPTAEIVPVHLDTWTAVALWVSQPWATVLLLSLGLALVIIEMLTWHSWGIAAVFGGALVAFIFAAHIAVGTSTWVGIVLFLLGIALLLFETHVFPGHGLSALAGLILIFLGMFFALGGAKTGALYSTAAALVTTVAVLAAFFAYLPRSPIWNKLGQPMRQTAQEGYVSSDDYTALLGQVGVAATMLRPSGTAEIDGLRLPVVSEGDYIGEGTPIQIVLVQGSRLVVRPYE